MKRFIFLTLALFAALAAAPGGQARGQWVQCDGPYVGGTVWAVGAVGNSLFASMDNGVYRSTNGGRTWSKANNGLEGSQITVFVTCGQEIFAGAFPYGDAGGIFASLDNGSNWSAVGNGTVVEGINTSLAGTGHYLATSDETNGYISGDNGNSWSEMTLSFNGDVFPYRFCSLVQVGNQLIGATGGTQLGGAPPFVPSGIYSSNDNGLSWTLVYKAYPTALTSIGTTLILSTSPSGMYRSTDNGATWNDITPTLIDTTVQCFTFIGSTLFASGPGFIIQSTDSGTVWTTADSGAVWTTSDINVASPYSIVGMATDGINLVACFFDGGLFRSPDLGSTWIFADTGLSFPTITAFGQNDSTLFAGSSSYYGFFSNYGLYRSTNNGISWDTVRPASDSNGSIDAFGTLGTNFYAGGSTVFRSIDGGNLWDSSATGLQWFGATSFATIGSMLFVGGNGIWRSTDSGMNWNPIDSLLLPRIYGNIYFNVASLDTMLFVVLLNYNDKGHIISGDIYRSTDNGLSWELADSGLPAFPIVNTIAVIGQNLYAAVGGYDSSGVYRSTDGGTTWHQVDSALLPNEFVGFGNDIFAADSGVYFSSDAGFHWTSLSEGLPVTSVLSLLISNNTVFAGTSDAGIWRRPLSDFGISSVAQTPVAAQQDIQSFPNPFTQSTEITFATQAAGYAEVSIVNALGAEVARLFAGELGSGVHSFAWDAARMAAPRGVYECVVRMNGNLQTLPVSFLH